MTVKFPLYGADIIRWLMSAATIGPSKSLDDMSQKKKKMEKKQEKKIKAGHQGNIYVEGHTSMHEVKKHKLHIK